MEDGEVRTLRPEVGQLVPGTAQQSFPGFHPKVQTCPREALFDLPQLPCARSATLLVSQACEPL